MKLLLSLSALAMLTGCATQSLYQWGGYESMLYAKYKDPAQAEAMQTKMAAHITAMETAGQKVAPGLYAELGTLYLQSGAADKALLMYGRERDTWPESKPLMTTMIATIERRQAKPVRTP